MMTPSSPPANRSVRAYRSMLVLFPRSYRHEYGDSMAQVFGDLTRERWDASGWFGLLVLWMAAIPDLLGSAFLVRARQWIGNGRHSVLARWGAGASMTGGVAWVVTVSWLFFHPAFNAFYLALWVCATVILFLVGLGGFYSEYREQLGLLAKAGFCITLGGLGIQLIGYSAGFLLGERPIIVQSFWTGIVMVAAGLGVINHGWIQGYGRLLSHWGKLLPALLFGLGMYWMLSGERPHFASIICFVIGLVWVNMGFVLLLKQLRPSLT